MSHRPISVAAVGLAAVLVFLTCENGLAHGGGHAAVEASTEVGVSPLVRRFSRGSAFNRTPSFSAPRPAFQPGIGAGVYRGSGFAPRQITPGQSFGGRGCPVVLPRAGSGSKYQ